MRPLLESLLTKVTMYSLVALSLSAVIGVALLLSIIGSIFVEPLEIIASATVLSAVSVSVNYVLGKLYGAAPQYQSALITALILTCLFTPTAEIAGLMELALVACLAQASKYILVYKSRHLFNPAAAGAMIAGLLGVVYATWWIVTPALIPITLVAAFLVLYKTRLLQVGALFIGAATTIIVISLITKGEDAGFAISSAITSWPTIFLAGFMLSEPLTLPPRKYQRQIVAVVIAAIFALPFHSGWFNSSPEFAILVGNLVAFILAFRMRAGLELTLKRRKSLTPQVDELTFTSPRPVHFEAGQYVELTLNHKADIRGYRRMFSLVSAPDSKEVKIAVKFYQPSSSFKASLKQLPTSSPVASTGISGDFVLPSNSSEKLLFIAGGIGITPFISHLMHLQATSDKRDIVLLYFVSSPSEAAYLDHLKSSGIRLKVFSAQKDDKKLFIQADRASSQIIKKYVPDHQERSLFISGPPTMVEEVRLVAKPLVKSVKTDYFSGY